MRLLCLLTIHRWVETKQFKKVLYSGVSYLFPTEPTEEEVTLVRFKCLRCGIYKQQILKGWVK